MNGPYFDPRANGPGAPQQPYMQNGQMPYGYPPPYGYGFQGYPPPQGFYAPYGAPFPPYQGYTPGFYPGFQQPPFRPPVKNENQGLSILCLILSILSIICFFIPYFYLLTMGGGVAAIVLASSMGQKEKAARGFSSGMNKAALVLGIIGVSLSVLNMLLGIVLTL